MKYTIYGWIVFCTALVGCSKASKDERSGAAKSESVSVFPNPEEQQQYVTDLVRFRAEKDSFLQTSPVTPLTREDRRGFHGLNYYEPNPQFVLRATLARNANPPPITITTTTGSTRKALKYGAFEFVLRGQKHRLSVYRFIDSRDLNEKEYLFVPFTDSTSGRETYGAGRYLDLEEDETGEYILDFNRAYNPYCAYNENYSCPIPPRENRLSAGITAGEKILH